MTTEKDDSGNVAPQHPHSGERADGALVWRSIESAPKDRGTLLLVYESAGGPRVVSGWFNEARRAPCWWCDAGEIEPSHWSFPDRPRQFPTPTEATLPVGSHEGETK